MQRQSLLLDRVLLALQAVAYAVITLSIGAQIVSRKLFNNPLAFPEELVVLLLVLATFWGAVTIEREGGHLRVDSLRRHLPKAATFTVELLSRLLALIFVTLLIVGELQLLPGAVKLTTPAAGIPILALHLAILCACLLWWVVSLHRLARQLAVVRRRWRSRT